METFSPHHQVIVLDLVKTRASRTTSSIHCLVQMKQDWQMVQSRNGGQLRTVISDCLFQADSAVSRRASAGSGSTGTFMSAYLEPLWISFTLITEVHLVSWATPPHISGVWLARLRLSCVDFFVVSVCLPQWVPQWSLLFYQTAT